MWAATVAARPGRVHGLASPHAARARPMLESGPLSSPEQRTAEPATPRWVLGLLACLTVLGVWGCLSAAPDQIFGDESDLIRPAQDHARWVFSHRVKYPSFALHLYGLSFLVTGVLDDLDACLRQARAINAVFFGLRALKSM